MTWEEELVERIRARFRPRDNPYTESDARRTRSQRLRDFLTAFGATHFAERVDGRRTESARRRQIAL